MKILLVEDDRLLNHHLKSILQEESHQVYAAHQAEEALHFAEDYPIDVGIIDLGLPDMDGLTLIRQLRAKQIAFPILILTAREAWEDKVQGLEAGADDYVTKPFQLEEVAARINALVRRASGLASAQIQAPPYQLDLSRKELMVEESPVRLTAFEYQILEFLMRRAGEVVSKETLMFQLYADAELRETHTIDVLMGRLRRKMQVEGVEDPITTVRGQGYRFDCPLLHQPT